MRCCLFPALWLLLAGHTLTAAPIVAAFTPAFGAPGIQVMLSGTGLSAATRVEFDTVLADFKSLTNGQFIAVVPAGAVTGPIRVTSPTGTGVSLTDFVVAPRLSGFSPRRGASGTIVTLDGVNLSGVNNVQFNGVNAEFSTTAPTQIRATVPVGATNGPIRVAGAAGIATTAADFIVTGPGPLVDGFSPRFAAPGTEILIEGANFTSVTDVRFNGVAATVFSVPAYTQIRAVVPSATTGKVTVTTTGGSGTSTNDFIVTTLPVITGFFPTTGKAGHTTVTIEGVNFSNLVAPFVWFNTQPVTGVGTPAQNQIRVTVPNGASTGPITVRNAAGYGQSFSNFIVTTAPIVDRFEPALGNPGIKVRLFGENFTGVSQVTFNGTAASFLPPSAQNQMEATVPDAATTGPITIQNGSGSFTTSSNFLVTPALPFITRFDPIGGPNGTAVLIYGVNFGTAPTVRFNGVQDATAYWVTEGAEQKIFAHVPAGAATGPITVTGPTGTSTNASLFFCPPWLVEFTPTNGCVGDTVVLKGTNFTGATHVWFNDGPAAATAQPGVMTALVPERARSGPLTVATPGGLITSTNAFRVLPRLTNFTPGLGATGAVVRLQGTSLHNVTAVAFNGVMAPFTNISFTEVDAIVPNGASTGPVRIESPDGSATSTNFFLVVGPSDLALGNAASVEQTPPHREVSFTLPLTNRGPWTVTEVILSGQLPRGFTNVSVQTDWGSCSVVTGWVSCHWNYLTNQAPATVVVRGTFASEGYATFTPGIVAVEGDTSDANNRASATVAVVSDRSRTLSISKSPNLAQVRLAWPTSSLPFCLESAPGLWATNQWSVVTNPQVSFQGQNIVTNALSNAQSIYRLKAVPPPVAR